jgi:hypothetical protein
MNLYKVMLIFRLEFEVHSEWVLMRFSILCRFVVETCKCLHKAKYLLMWEAVERLGMDTIQQLVKQVSHPLCLKWTN